MEKLNESTSINYISRLTVGSRVVIGKGECDCGASVVAHPSVMVETVVASNFGFVVTETGVHGAEAGSFTGVLDPSVCLDAEYALCEDSLNHALYAIRNLSLESEAKPFLELEIDRLEYVLDRLVEKVVARL